MKTPARSSSCVLLALSFCLLTACADDPLIRVNTEKEANEILVKLAENDIASANKTAIQQGRDITWQVTVPPDQLLKARQVLVELDLPRGTHGGYEQMLATTGLIPTKTDERARLMYAMAGELAQTLEVYEGVVQARVHVVTPDQDLMRRRGEEGATPTATVLIKHAEGLTPDGNGPVPSKEQVIEMVASSVEGLTPTAVTVSYTVAPKMKEIKGASSVSKLRDPKTQAFAGAAVFALLSVALFVLLLKEKAKNR